MKKIIFPLLFLATNSAYSQAIQVCDNSECEIIEASKQYFIDESITSNTPALERVAIVGVVNAFGMLIDNFEKDMDIRDIDITFHNNAGNKTSIRWRTDGLPVSIAAEDLVYGEIEILGSEEKYIAGKGLFSITYFRRWNGTTFIYFSDMVEIQGPPQHQH